MDGYALPMADAGHPADTRFRVTGDILAGAPEAPLNANEAVAVATGARVPTAAGMVIPREQVVRTGDLIVLTSAIAPGAHIRLADDDFRAGQRIASAGTRVDPVLFATLIGCGLIDVPVFDSPRCRIIVTGDEVVPFGEALAPGQRIDTNGPLVAAWLSDLGIEADRGRPLADDPEHLRAAITAAAATHDLLIVTGGASVGPADFTPALFHELGEILFWRVAVKPGMPVLAARIGDCVAIGLPGNPVSVFAGLNGFIAPILRLWFHQSARESLMARVAAPIRKTHGRLEWRRGTLVVDALGQRLVTAHPVESSGAMRSVVESTVLIELAADRHDWATGDTVPVLDYRPM